MHNGYQFMISTKTYKIGGKLTIGKKIRFAFPVTPSSVDIQIGNQNETVTLINEGEINILKAPSLTEITFTARLPRRPAPYTATRTIHKAEWYLEQLEYLKVHKMPFVFQITDPAKLRVTTSMEVSLEEYKISEDSDEGDDVLVDITLKQYKSYRTKTVVISNNTPKPPISTTKPSTTTASKTYVVKKGDCLWNIAKKYYGKGSEWKKIYNANKTVIENTAKKYGRKSSSNGWWIYPGTKLTIPA